MGMRPVHLLRIGGFVKPRFDIDDARIAHWKYKRDRASLGGGMTRYTKLKIVDTSDGATTAWVKLDIPGRRPAAYLKVSGEETSWCFEDLQ